MRSQDPNPMALGVTDLLGGIGSAAPGPIFLVDDVGRVHAINERARQMGERHPASEAFVSTVTLADKAVGHVVGYVAEAENEEAAPLVSALVALAADVLSKTWQRRATSDPPARPNARAEAILAAACERLSNVLDEDAIAQLVVDAARDALSADAAVLLTLADSRRSLVPRAAAGVDGARLAKVVVGKGLLGWAATQADVTCIDTWHRLPAGAPRHVAGRCAIEWWMGLPFVAVPVLSGSQLVALLCVSGVAGSCEAPAREAAALLERLADKTAANLAGARVVRQVRREERVQREIEIARQIQASLLPQGRPEFAGLDVAGECRPAAQVGGDYFGFRVDEPGCLTTTVFDVTGHGIGAAFCLTLVRSALNGELARGGNPARALTGANGLVWDDVASSGLFATALVCRFDRAAKRMTYGSAGHVPPVHWSGRTRGFVEHERGGLPLGLMPDSSFSEYEADFAEGDVFVAYTDGVTEAAAPSGERFGRGRLLGIVRRTRRKPARRVLEAIWRELTAFTGGVPLADDATVLVIKGARQGAARVDAAEGRPAASRAERPLDFAARA